MESVKSVRENLTMVLSFLMSLRSFPRIWPRMTISPISPTTSEMGTASVNTSRPNTTSGWEDRLRVYSLVCFVPRWPCPNEPRPDPFCPVDFLAEAFVPKALRSFSLTAAAGASEPFFCETCDCEACDCETCDTAFSVEAKSSDVFVRESEKAFVCDPFPPSALEMPVLFPGTTGSPDLDPDGFKPPAPDRSSVTVRVAGTPQRSRKIRFRASSRRSLRLLLMQLSLMQISISPLSP